jgi:CheY-like chemotaxis protein
MLFKRNKKKILLVDDDEIQLALSEMLLKKKYEIVIARSGKEALERLCHGLAPNLILLDIVMPNMDGWETFGRIKAISLLHEVPIIFLTSITEKTEMERAHQIGAADFITKPFEGKDFHKRIKEAIEKNK